MQTTDMPGEAHLSAGDTSRQQQQERQHPPAAACVPRVSYSPSTPGACPHNHRHRGTSETDVAKSGADAAVSRGRSKPSARALDDRTILSPSFTTPSEKLPVSATFASSKSRSSSAPPGRRLHHKAVRVSDYKREKAEDGVAVGRDVTILGLPAYGHRVELINTINNNKGTGVAGETGCGKTIQVPQYLLETPKHMQQPHQNPFCHYGHCHQGLAADPLLMDFTHVLIDEVHERTEQIDVLLAIFKDILAEREKKLSVVLLSATIQEHVISEYFDEAPVCFIRGTTYPVAVRYLEVKSTCRTGFVFRTGRAQLSMQDILEDTSYLLLRQPLCLQGLWSDEDDNLSVPEGPTEHRFRHQRNTVSRRRPPTATVNTRGKR
ncbi:unnamed protein product [Vitrella brassicaformis CCMP3155]|uniref:Helicase ATP-binding domain-containing protein n=1 Tax=Vitrella brassicaformis (strain CCMP3155) TaxID=1169540 RepID=A0A0G4GMG8_VITBC|nr:unnamed protein product [Vitrella brassicaformis CCMP3155]|eukprot:CEM31403.1 unnamed protein product [Vitrella brassicaformis CCMP3155]